MNINNIQYITNKFSPNKQNLANDSSVSSKTPIFFRGKLITKELSLNKKSHNALQNLSILYEKITSVISKHNTSDTKQIKAEFPNLLSYRNLKGLTFDHFGINKDKRIQIVQFNTKESSDELITINILDKNNNNILKCRTSKEGEAKIIYDEDNERMFDIKAFEHCKANNSILNNIIKTLEALKIYVENLGKIRQNLRNNSEKTNILNSISKIQALKNSNGIKDEISKTMNIYTEVSNLLNKTKGKDSFILKTEYFGSDYNLKNKGLDFSNLSNNYNNFSICPLKSKNDNRIFRIITQNDNDSKAFVFYDNGKVSQQKTFDISTNGFRPNNLSYITDEEINLFNIPEILNKMNKELENFKQFIINSRQAKTSAKQEKRAERINKLEEEKLEKQKEILKRKEDKKIEKEKQIAIEKELKQQEKIEKQKEKARQQEEIRIQKEKIKEQLKAEKEAKKLEQKQIKEKLKAEKEAKKLEQKQIKEKLKAEKEAKKLEQKQIKEKLKAEKKAKKLEQAKISSVEITPKETIKAKYSEGIFKDNINYLKISDLVEELNKVFATPVEERSKHLKHKKLPNGKYFNGQFTLKSSDGANITVSRVKSPKYVEFTYYSINIDKNGTKTTINIDPTRNSIIKSENGKPIIVHGITIKYIGLKKIIQEEPTLNNLPKYLNEIFC